MSRLVLGLNVEHGDTAAALLGQDGTVAAVAQERVDRCKHSGAFPAGAAAAVLRIAGADARDVTDLAIARNPRANKLAKLRFLMRNAQVGARRLARSLRADSVSKSVPRQLAVALGLPSRTIRSRVHHVEHHLAHVASAYYSSPFEHCAAITVDGTGDFASTMCALCEGNEIRILRRTAWPYSLGVFYTALCQYLGFDRYGEEFKVMGLSAYGEAANLDVMRDLVRFDARDGLRLDLRYFRHHRSAVMERIVDGEVRLDRLWSRRLSDRLGPERDRDAPIRDRDLAASLQRRYEEVFLDLVRRAVAETGRRRWVLAGGGCVELGRQWSAVPRGDDRRELVSFRSRGRRHRVRGSGLGPAWQVR